MLAEKAAGKQFDRVMDNATGAKKTYQAVKASEQSILKKYADQGIAAATGIPLDAVSQFTTDFKGKQAAKKVRKATNGNVLAQINNIGSQVYGAVGGIIKSAVVATGVKEREIQAAIPPRIH